MESSYWNIQGINSKKKWNATRDRVTEYNYDVICLQETKRSQLDISFLCCFYPVLFYRFEFLPSIGASGGSIIIWKSSIFSRGLVFQNEFASSVLFTSLHNNSTYILTNVYAPCTPLGKPEFFHWFKNISMPETLDLLVVGNFNLCHNPQDLNKLRVDYAEMLCLMRPSVLQAQLSYL